MSQAGIEKLKSADPGEGARGVDELLAWRHWVEWAGAVGRGGGRVRIRVRSQHGSMATGTFNCNSER